MLFDCSKLDRLLMSIRFPRESIYLLRNSYALVEIPLKDIEDLILNKRFTPFPPRYIKRISIEKIGYNENFETYGYKRDAEPRSLWL